MRQTRCRLDFKLQYHIASWWQVPQVLLIGKTACHYHNVLTKVKSFIGGFTCSQTYYILLSRLFLCIFDMQPCSHIFWLMAYPSKLETLTVKTCSTSKVCVRHQTEFICHIPDFSWAFTVEAHHVLHALPNQTGFDFFQRKWEVLTSRGTTNFAWKLLLQIKLQVAISKVMGLQWPATN